MNKTIQFLLTIVILLSVITAVAWTPQGNVDLKSYYNMTNLSYFEGFSMKGNISATGYNITSDHFKGNLTWTYLDTFPSACSASFGVSEIGDSSICTHFMLGTGDTVTGNYSLIGNHTFAPTGAFTGLFINQDYNNYGLSVDSESTSQAAIRGTGKYGLAIIQDLADGYGLDIRRNIDDAETLALVRFVNNHISDTFPTLSLQNDGSGAHITTGATNEDLEINPDGTGSIKFLSSNVNITAGNLILNFIATNHLILPLLNDATTPTLAFGDGDTGFYEQSDDVFILGIGGANSIRFDVNLIQSFTANSWKLANEQTSATNPTLIPNKDDDDTGISRAGADILSLIAGATEIIRATFTASGGFVTIGNGTAQVNITMTSQDASEWCCGVNNAGTFSCSSGACS